MRRSCGEKSKQQYAVRPFVWKYHWLYNSDYLDQLFTASDFVDYKGGALIREKPDLTVHRDETYRIGCTGKSGGQAVRVYDLKGKSVTLQSQAGGGGAKTGLYLVNGEVKALSKTAAMKLQTVPEWYDFPVSDQQAISLIGNGWTVDVIVHICEHIIKDMDEFQTGWTDLSASETP